MSAEIKITDPLPKLGPPMELAETRANDFAARLRCLRFIYKTFISLLFIFLAFSMGIYLLVNKVHENKDIDITMSRGLKKISNVTIFRNDIESNNTFKKCNRQKRDVRSSQYNEEKSEDVFKSLSSTEIMRAREIIVNHKAICNKENQNKICRDIVMKLKSITQHDQTSKITQDRGDSESDMRTNEKFTSKEDNDADFYFDDIDRLTTITKRETPPTTHVDTLSTNLPESIEHTSHPHNLPHNHPHTRISTSQAHAQSDCPNGLRHSNQDSYYVTNFDYLPQQEYPISYTGYYNPSKGSSIETRSKKIHPQDAEIFKQFLEEAVKTRNSTLREAPCPEGTILCANGNECLDEKQWCDGYTDCTDLSDETQCSCKSRVDKSRLCDGYFDCPYGEDEMGCFGCSANTFSCEGQDSESQKTCFSREERCDGHVNCPNSYDEIDCNLLSPNLLEKPMYAVSNTEGFLQRNFKGKWYAICKNPYMWAHDVCRREAGLVLRPPHIEGIHIDPAQKISYLNTDPVGIVYRSEKCVNSTAAYVICLDLMCGTRVISRAQLIKQRAKENLFGRNKRYLSHSESPFHISDEFEDYSKGAREKRVLESRVVGGQASQPAAWPWMVALYRDGSFHCGGVIITRKWVMSAAHCVSKFWDHYYEVQVGMLRRFSFSPQEHNHRVTHILINRNYDNVDMKNDLSLLIVEPNIQFSRWIRPVCLPSRETAGPDWLWGPKEGTTCIAVGWGATAERGMDPDHLREVEVPVWAQCKRREDREGKEICAGFFQGGKDACQGDSGGPLLCRNPSNAQQWYVAGIVSHGNGCARKNEPGVYTRVSLFIKWIKSTMGSHNLPTIQPKQECPGFKCMSGIPRCLPKKRVCDSIIDCLGGEDEIYNCNFRSAQTISENIQENLTLNNENIKINSTFNENLLNEDLLREKTEKNKNLSLSVTELVNNMINATSETTEIAKLANKEINSKESFEQFDNISYSYTTDNPSENPLDTTSSTESTETTRGDYNEYTFMTSPHDQLQSKSLKLNEVQTRIQNKEADINEDWSDIFSNPETSTSFMTTEKKAIQTVVVQNQDVLTVTEKTTVTTNEMTTEKETKTLEMELFASTTPSLSHNINKNIGEQSMGTLKNNITLHDFLSNSSKLLEGIQNKRGVPLEKEHTVKLQPAKIRKRHRVPKDFTCGRIYQIIPYHLRCNQKADCEDGTDELSCTCVDYVTTFNNELICDGIFDCAEGEDESDCYGCEGENFLCKKSETCLPSRYVCNGKNDCPQGEDESECLTLSNGREIFYDFAGKPKVNIEGFLTRKHSNEWHVVCENNRFSDKQEETATHVCRYLGFSSAIRFTLKYINIKETGQNGSQSLEGKLRSRRTTLNRESVHFMYNESDEDENLARHVTIETPDFIKERCVPNVTKTCTSLYIVCDQSLFTNFENPGLLNYERSAESTTSATWPWIAKVFVEGHYKCTGVLIDVSWVLISHICLLDSMYSHATPHISVVLGSHRTLTNINGPYEQTYHVDGKIDIFHSKAILLHMREPAFYSAMVKPMKIPYINPYDVANKTCVAVGEDNDNTTITIFLEETNENCDYNSVCFKRQTNTKICSPKKTSQRPWAGIISCHTSQGWYPMATFVDSRGECGVEDRINATEIGNIRNDIKLYFGKMIQRSHFDLSSDTCEGERCGRGRCIGLQQLCDGIKDCENGNDESENACEKKKIICDSEPFYEGCVCTTGQMKCRNGRCIAKELFRDGFNDCGDGTDEPVETTCSDYLRTVMPSRLCDGILHCEDRSDEDPSYCKCHAKNAHACGRNGQDLNKCVAPDMVCDGTPDCPNGEDESTCSALSGPPGTPHGTGLVIIRSHGQDWHAKCFPKQHHTRLELETICKQLGFLGGHAKQLIAPGNSVYDVPTDVILDPFKEIVLNNKTKIKLRNTDSPIARTVLSKNITNCYSLFIECL